MPITCPTCGKALAADDVNLEQAIGRCQSCNQVFSLAEQAGGAARHRPAVDMPRGFHVAELPDRLTITRRWLGCSIVALIIFAAFWNGIAMTMFTVALLGGAWPIALFLLLFLAVGLTVIYVVIAMLFNTTTIDVDVSRVRIHHGPVPWPGGGEYDPAKIGQLYCREKISRNNNSTSYTYELHAILLDGTRKKLIGSLTKSDQALFLEQRLEKAIGITDRAVEGELTA